MKTPEMLERVPVAGEDVVRWLTFTSFWGSISYLLASTSIAAAHTRQPLQIDMRTLGVGMGLHVATAVALGSASAAGFAIAKGERTTEVAERRIAGGELERSVVRQGLGAAVGSLLPFAMAAASLRLAEQITGEPAFGDADAISWPAAMATMVAASGLTSLAVARITSWVARDAKQGQTA
jgi:hypothetical protein